LYRVYDVLAEPGLFALEGDITRVLALTPIDLQRTDCSHHASQQLPERSNGQARRRPCCCPGREVNPVNQDETKRDT
jgi:hypothetical protein